MKILGSRLQSFGLDFRRILGQKTAKSWLGLSFELIGQPLIVACLVTIAYLLRISEISYFREQFLYFSTMYAFWVGMFGSCQSFNGVLRNGEWRYWVLGMHRSKISYALATITVNLGFALIQVAMFVIGILLCCYFSNGTERFIQVFLASGSGDGSTLLQMNGNLSLVLRTGWLADWGPCVYSVLMFLLALVLAMLSGTGIGIFLSAFFKVPQISLNITVGILVIIGVVSYVGLKAGNGESRSGDKVDHAFWPSVEQVAWQETSDAEEREENVLTSAVRHLVVVSRILPQRYFFNAARILTWPENLKRGAWEKTLARGGVCGAEETSVWMKRQTSGRTAYSLMGIGALLGPQALDECRTLCDNSSAERDVVCSQYFVDYLRAHPDVRQRWRGWERLVWCLLWQEVWPILAWFLGFVGLTLSLLTMKKAYYEIR